MAGGGLGTAGFIVYDDTRNTVDVADQVSRFLHVESCGRCNSCRLGTHDITALLEHLVLGTDAGTDMIASFRRHLAGVTDSARCYLPTEAQVLIASLLDRFPDDLAQRLAGAPGDTAPADRRPARWGPRDGCPAAVQAARLDRDRRARPSDTEVTLGCCRSPRAPGTRSTRSPY